MGFPHFGQSVVDAVGYAHRNALQRNATVVDASDLLYALVANRLTKRVPLLWNAVVELSAGVRNGRELPHELITLEHAPDHFNEHQWKIRTLIRDSQRAVGVQGESGLPIWSAEVGLVFERTLAEAAERGLHNAHGGHLLAAALAVNGASVRTLLEGAGLSVADVQHQTMQFAQLDEDGTPMVPSVRVLQMFGIVKHESSVARALSWPIRTVVRKRSLLGTAMAVAIGQEAMRQAAGYGSRRVSNAHLLLAILATAQQLSLANRKITAGLRSVNRGAEILAAHGVDYFSALSVTSAIAAGDSAEHSSAVSTRVPMPMRVAADQGWTLELAAAFDAAYDMANKLGHKNVGDSHLLIALLASPESTAYRALAQLRIDPPRVSADVNSSLTS